MCVQNVYESIFNLVILFVILLTLQIGIVYRFVAELGGFFLFGVDLFLEDVKTERSIDLFEHLLSHIAYHLVLDLGENVAHFLFLLVYHVPDYLFSADP